MDYLNGNVLAKEELEKFAVRSISQITWIEVMVGAEKFPDTREPVERLLRQFLVVPIDDEVAALAAKRRATTGKKLPDCIIHATALLYASEVITGNTRDFPSISGDAVLARNPYQPPPAA